MKFRDVGRYENLGGGGGNLGKIVIQELLKKNILPLAYISTKIGVRKSILIRSPCPLAPWPPFSPFFPWPPCPTDLHEMCVPSQNVTAFLEYGDERLASFRGLEIRDVGKYL